MLPDESAGQRSEGTSGLPGCSWHPERETGISCTRCERPICPECMVSASVGFQCPECVRGAAAQTRQPTTRFGGGLVGDGALVTKILIGINLAVFLLTQYVDPSLFDRLALISRLDLRDDNGFVVAVFPGMASGPSEWYRLLTSMFVHNGLFHIGANMVSLWVIGPQLERVLGRARYLALYFVSGLAGGSLAYLVSGNHNLFSVGASGAIFGLFGATVVLFRLNRVPLGPVIALIAFNLVVTFSVPSIDWRAHIGGLVGGAVTAVGLMYAPRAHRSLVQWLTVAGMLGVVVLSVVVETARING